MDQTVQFFPKFDHSFEDFPPPSSIETGLKLIPTGYKFVLIRKLE